MSADELRQLNYSSWIRNIPYRQLFRSGAWSIPENLAGITPKTALAFSIVDFIDHAEIWKREITFRRLLEDRLTLPMSLGLVDHLTSVICELSSQDSDLIRELSRERECRISMIMRVYAERHWIPASITGYIVDIPSMSSNHVYYVHPELKKMKPSRLEVEREFFGVNAPLILEHARFDSLNPGVQSILDQHRVLHLAESNTRVTTSEEIELAAEICWLTGATPEVSRQAVRSCYEKGQYWRRRHLSEHGGLIRLMHNRVRSRRAGSLIYNRWIPSLTSEQWVELDLHFFGKTV